MTTQTAKIPRSISRIAYAMITETNQETGVDTYGEVKTLMHIHGGREYTATPVGEQFKVYADGLEVYAEDENQGYEISLTTVAVSDDVEEDWYGNLVQSDGVAEFADNGRYPEFALFLYEDTTDGVGTITFFGKCHITARREKAGNTKEDGSIDPQYPVHTIAAVPRWNDRFVKKVINGKQKLTAVPEVSRRETPLSAQLLNEDEDE